MALWQPRGLWGLLTQSSCSACEDTPSSGVLSEYLTSNITRLVNNSSMTVEDVNSWPMTRVLVRCQHFSRLLQDLVCSQVVSLVHVTIIGT